MELIKGYHVEWLVNYLRFLGKMGVKDPLELVRDLTRWSVYSFAPGATTRDFTPPLVSYRNVAEAVRVFYRDGYVVLHDGLTPEEATKLGQLVRAKAERIIQMDRDGTLPPGTKHGHNRFSFAEYGPSPEWEYLAHDERILGVVRAIWKGRPFRALAAGGDFVLPGGQYQNLHNDMGWKAAGERVPRVVTVNFYVSDVLPISGPIRMVPGTARFPVPNSVVNKFEPEWMKQCVVTGKLGYVVIRDPRTWHGGTPNTSTEPRFMPNVEYSLQDAPLSEVGGNLLEEQLSRGKWIADFANP